MITSSPTRKVSTSWLSKSVLVITHKIGGIVEVFDVVSSIPLRSVSSLTNKILHRTALTFLYCSLVKQTVYLKGFCDIGVTVDEHDGWYVRAEAKEGIIGWGRCWLQLSHRENIIHSPIKGNFQPIRKPAYLLKYTKRTDVLLGELLSDAGGGQNGITLM